MAIVKDFYFRGKTGRPSRKTSNQNQEMIECTRRKKIRDEIAIFEDELNLKNLFGC